MHTAAVEQDRSITDELGKFGSFTSPENTVYKPLWVEIKTIKVDKYPCNCQLHLWAKWGDKRLKNWGYAGNIPIESEIPFEYGFVIFKGNPGHISEYRLVGEELLVTDEANRTPCKITSGRRISIYNTNIKGYLEL